jgi:beta-barrel assembly-enhancing protease
MPRLTRTTLPLLALALVGCGVEGTGLLISDAQEAQLGAQVHDQVLLEYAPITDPEVNAWVTELGTHIASASVGERSGVTYRFHVLETDRDFVNAFAAPGGYIYLTRGLILAASSEAEVAGVLGHEVGHVAHRHGVARLERAVAAGLVADLVFGQGTFGADAVNFVTGFVLTTDYSRDQERDADMLGVDFTYGARINPLGLVDFFNRLAVGGGSSIFDWLSSHPNPADRARDTARRIERIHPGFNESTPGFSRDITGRFGNIRARLDY